MSSNNYMYMEEGETSEQCQLKEINYNCSECSSLIEIISINENENSIEFQCLNKNNTHIRKMSINEYITKMKNYRNEDVNGEICKIHKEKYEYYCSECNIHLCKNCLKSRNHINHIKNIIIEVQPNKKELDIFENIIKNYEDKIENLSKDKISKIKVLNNKFKNNKNELNQRKELNSKEIKTKIESELKLLKDKYDKEIDNLNNLKKLIEIIYNTYNLYNNNYYYAKNLNVNLINFYYNKNNDKFKNIMDIRNLKEKEIINSIINDYERKIE